MNRFFNNISVTFISLFLLVDCSNFQFPKNSTNRFSLEPISTINQLDVIIEHSGSHLICFYLYANWCIPCKILEPRLISIARDNVSRITIYKIDIDLFPQMTTAFSATGIPFTIYIKNKKVIQAFLGVHPRSSYEQIIKIYSDTTYDTLPYNPFTNGQCLKVDKHHSNPVQKRTQVYLNSILNKN
jgi:thiol-disulfide isomerase/thioredoxin